MFGIPLFRLENGENNPNTVESLSLGTTNNTWRRTKKKIWWRSDLAVREHPPQRGDGEQPPTGKHSGLQGNALRGPPERSLAMRGRRRRRRVTTQMMKTEMMTIQTMMIEMMMIEMMVMETRTIEQYSHHESESEVEWWERRTGEREDKERWRKRQRKRKRQTETVTVTETVTKTERDNDRDRDGDRETAAQRSKGSCSLPPSGLSHVPLPHFLCFLVPYHPEEMVSCQYRHHS